MAFTLYRLDFTSGKSYVGQTVRALKTRINAHRTAAVRGSMLPVHCAWRAHGEPVVHVVGEFESYSQLHDAEIALIESLGTLSPGGYNISRGGDTAPSKNPEVAAKIAAKARGRKREDVESLREASLKNWQDPSYREKVSAGLKSAWTDEMRAAAGDRSKARWDKRRAEGWTMPESTKEKLRGKVFSEETRSRMSASAKGKPKAPRSEKTCAALSSSTAATWASMTQEQRAARGDAIRRGHALRKAAIETTKLTGA